MINYTPKLKYVKNLLNSKQPCTEYPVMTVKLMKGLFILRLNYDKKLLEELSFIILFIFKFTMK